MERGLRPRLTAAPRRAAGLGLALVLALAWCGSVAAQGELSPRVRFDVLEYRLDQALRDQQHAEIVALIDKMRATGLEVGAVYDFYQARAYAALGRHGKARKVLVRYLNATAGKGENYRGAIALYVRLEEARKAAEAHAEEVAAARREWEAARSEYRDWLERAGNWRSRVITLGARRDDMAWSLARAADGGFVVAGSYERGPQPGPASERDGPAPQAGRIPWMVAVDAEGRMAWNRVIGKSGDYGSLRSAEAWPGGGFLFGGFQRGFQVVVRADRRGAPISNHEGDPWVMVYGRADGAGGGIVRRLADGNIVAFGAEILERGADRRRLPFAVRLSPEGRVLGRTIYGGEGPVWYEIADAVVLAGGDVVASGEARARADDPASAAAWLVRIAPDGSRRWSRRIAAEGGEGVRVSALAATPDGGVIAAGRDGDALLTARLRKDGSVAWTRRRAPDTGLSPAASAVCAKPGLDALLAEAYAEAPRAEDFHAELAAFREMRCREGRSIASAAAIVRRPGGYLILGFRGRGDASDTDIWLLAVTEEGEVAWERVYGHTGFDLAAAALPTADGGYVIAGTTDSVGEGGRDVMMFKIDGDGDLAPWAALGPPPSALPPPGAAGEEADTAAPEAAVDADESGAAGPSDGDGQEESEGGGLFGGFLRIEPATDTDERSDE